MSTKLEAINDPNSCWNKARDDEPIFTLRAKDLLSSGFVLHWAHTADLLGCSENKVLNARKTSKNMVEWAGKKENKADFPS